MSYLRYVAIFVVIALMRSGDGKPAFSAANIPREPTLTVRQEADRVVMSWSGEVKAPMREKFAEAFKALGNKRHNVLISFNSPGGSVDHGHEVIEVIHKAAKQHYIETMVGANSICASMCVPLYLSGVERFASPSARFMFHEVILVPKPGGDADAMRKLGLSRLEMAKLKRVAESYQTDKLFEEGFESKLDNRWLERLRERIRGRDLWLTARQLVDEKALLVDKLI